MRLNLFYKRKSNLETFSFEKNFSPLSKTLYYFSFLGNIFLILFSYFFIKNVTDSIPTLFTGQSLFFSIFIILFMTGYELFKRFAFEQLTLTILKLQKITLNIALGMVVSLALVSGSFYLSLNGAHRLIDTSSTIEAKLDTVANSASDSITLLFQKRIDLKEQQIQAIQDNDENGVLNNRQKASVKALELDIQGLERDRDKRIAAVESKINTKLTKQTAKVQENDFAFAAMVFFLEFIILIGVAFSAYYNWTSYVEMKGLLQQTRFKQLDLHLRLLKILYQNGRKKEGDEVIPQSKIETLATNLRVDFNPKDIEQFLILCEELDIIVPANQEGKAFYNMSYEKAIPVLEKQEDL